MMYVLTQEEFDELKTVQKKAKHKNTKELQKLCTKIADEMPVVWGWGGPDPKPWGCVITKQEIAEKQGYQDEWYCDNCPVQTICPSISKPYSK